MSELGPSRPSEREAEVEVTHEGSGDAGTGAAGDEGGAGGLDLSPVLEHVTKLGETLEGRLGEFESRLPQQEDQYERNDLGQFAGQTPYPGQQFGPEVQGQPGLQQPLPPGSVDEYGQLTEQGEAFIAQQQLAQTLAPFQQQITQQSQAQQQAIQQLQGTIQELQMDRGAERLEIAYPELKDPAKAQALVDAALPFAERIGRPDLVGDDGFLELVHKAQRADQAAAAETPAGPGPQLEPAGGASLAGGEPDIRQSILAAGNKNRVWGV